MQTARRLLPLLLGAALVAVPAAAAPQRSYQRVVMSVANMVDSERARSLVAARQLDLINVLWEDTGRYEGSSVGPNISDVTIEVDFATRRGKQGSALMPVMRYPNFSDKTGDVRLDKFFVPVGNEKEGGQLRVIPLSEYLSNPTAYMSRPQHGTIKRGSLLAKRDRHLLVSAQAAFLPVPREGQATFRPVIFNYQSYRRHPAVLVILVTRQGTSMSVVDNSRDTLGRDSWGQRLFFNAGGKRAPLTAERLSDVQQRGTTANGEAASTLKEDANLLLLIQVPLKVRAMRRPAMASPKASKAMDSMGSGAGAAPTARGRGGSDVESAVLGHGPLEGPFTELAGLTVERDPRFPIRVTAQFYQATSNGVVNHRDVRALAQQIRRVYRQADYVGSLVLPDGAPRPTRWDGAGAAPAGLTWRDFPGLYERYERFGLWGLWIPAPLLARLGATN